MKKIKKEKYIFPVEQLLEMDKDLITFRELYDLEYDEEDV